MNKINFSVGFFFLIGLIAVLFLALRVSNLVGTSFKDGYSLVAYFDNVGGLKEKAAVRSSGVLIGRVYSVEFDDSRYQAKVVFKIEKNKNFPKDSSAKILTSGLLGENYVGISPGAELEYFKPGDKIYMTQSAVILENVISQFLYNSQSDNN
jgi:phospholipid/cholesterol/gamma-HCH transport system substrate-binding protein